MNPRIGFSSVAAVLCFWIPVLAAGPNPITNGSFETVAPDGRAPGWEFLGNARVVVGASADGKRALRLLRSPAASGETGLNRAWQPNSGEQGGMLSQRKGAIRFHYRAEKQEAPGALTVQIIPMTEKPLEFGGHRTIWRVPESHVGDGKWHTGELAYDYSPFSDVKWVHVGARLLAPGELWLDAFEWVPAVDAVPQFLGLEFAETPGREGTEGVLEAVLTNLGSRPLAKGRAKIALPPGLACPRSMVDTPVLPPGETATLDWRVVGTRARPVYDLRIELQAGGKIAADRLRLERSVQLSALRCGQSMIAPGRPIRLELIARNTGHVLVGSVRCSLEAPTGVRVQAIDAKTVLLPGRAATIAAWNVTVPMPTPTVVFRAKLVDSRESVETRLLVAAPGAPPEGPSTPAFAAHVGDWFLVGSRKVRLALFPVVDAVRAAFLQVRRGAEWQTVALIPHLGLVRTQRGEAAFQFRQCESKGGARNSTLILTGTTVLDGVQWRSVCELRASPGKDTIGYRLSVSPEVEAEITAVEGPMLYAGGEGLPKRDDAILPGLEWLIQGEESSNALDIKPDHPDRVRYVPHPGKITVPAVGMRFGDVAVGLLWAAPPAQASYALAGSLSLVFASPDRFEGSALHLAGLMLPGVDKGLGENSRSAEKPLRLRAGQELVIAAELLGVTGAADSLVALDRWYARYGVPQPLPFPRGSAKAEIAFSLKAYARDKALWNPKWGKWYSDIIVGFRPTLEPAEELLLGAALLGDSATAKWARRLAGEVLGSQGEKSPVLPEYRADPAQVRAAIRRAQQLVMAQKDDGNWVFSGKKAAETWPKTGVDYKKLGPAGARAVGLTAANATAVLEGALLSGDPDLWKAGLKALEAMRGFRVPRAAQVWEVPVHTPDILASAKAVQAFLDGYRLTGDRAYLDDAVYWARTGLPFVYVWHASDRPAMQGATVPVFGATAYVLSWFAVAVQWNGLVYSGALYDLARYDHSFPWTRVADNILRSGMYQQATEGDRFGQWPDALNFIAERRGPHGQTPPCFRPTTIIDQTLLGLGIRRRPTNTLVRRGARRLVLRTTAGISGIDWSGERLQFTARYTRPQRGAVVLFNLERPRRVLLNGAPLPERKELTGNISGWRMIPSGKMLEIRLGRSATARLAIEGVRPIEVAWAVRFRASIDFDFSKGLQDWTSRNDLAPLRQVGGVLETTTTGADPYMSSGPLRAVGRAGDILEIDIAVSGAHEPIGASVYWGTSQEPGYSPARTLTVPCPGDGQFHVVRIPVGEHPQWRDHTIAALRIDPLGGEKGCRVRIRSVRLRRVR